MMWGVEGEEWEGGKRGEKREAADRIILNGKMSEDWNYAKPLWVVICILQQLLYNEGKIDKC